MRSILVEQALHSEIVLACDQPAKNSTCNSTQLMADLTEMTTKSAGAISKRLDEAMNQLEQGKPIDPETLSHINYFIASANQLNPTDVPNSLNLRNAIKAFSR